MMQRIVIFLVGILLYVGVGMATSEPPHESAWIFLHDKEENFKVSFPFKPVEMHFDVPTEKGMKDHLHIYSAALPDTTFITEVVHSDRLLDQELNEKFFGDLLYSHFLKILFYYPRIFKRTQFEYQPMSFRHYQAIRFATLYKNPEIKAQKLLTGYAIVNQNKMYILACIVDETNYNENQFRKFIESFHFIHQER